MEEIRNPKQLLDYQPIGRRPGWLFKESTEGHNSEAENNSFIDL